MKLSALTMVSLAVVAYGVDEEDRRVCDDHDQCV
jgi:hypothetical protein